MKFKEPRLHQPSYLSNLRKLPCLRCGTGCGVQAAHIRMINLDWGQRVGIRTGAGGGEKPADYWAVPLCHLCHVNGTDAEHRVGTARFWKAAGIDPHKVAHLLNEAHPDLEAMLAVIMQVRFLGEGAAA